VDWSREVSASFAVEDIFRTLRAPQFRFGGYRPFSPHLSTFFDGAYLVGRELDLHFQFVMLLFPEIATALQKLLNLVLWRQIFRRLQTHGTPPWIQEFPIPTEEHKSARTQTPISAQIPTF
jgi:hypothetical protein